MTIIQQSIRYPVTTAVGVILIVMFGTIALFRLPVQLTPNVEKPLITVNTIWPGASPMEIERDIVQEQEDQLKTLEGLLKMESESSDSNGLIRLEFQVGTNLDAALLRASNLLEQVPEYPDDAEKPVIRTTDPTAGALAWFSLLPIEENGFDGDISTLYDFVDDFVKPEFERVPGVASSNMFGGRPHEMHVIVDPGELAARQVTMNQIAVALDRENNDYSGGDFDEGKRRYIVRTVGEFDSPEAIEDIVVAVRNGTPVYLRDVGRAELAFRKPGAYVFNMGRPVLAVNAIKEAGANAFSVMQGVREAQDRLNNDRLAEMGLRLEQVYDQTDYIQSSIDLVQQSLLVGGLLAIGMLLLYLRSATSTLVIAVAIPISIIGAFMGMLVLGRTLNVISLAGMAFAVGMVVDNSIVVLENIYRHRQAGKTRVQAAFEGAREVWGAVLASTLTTIAVFVPIIFMQEEVGQLFGDIALALSVAVGLSLIVSITVIPSLSAKMIGGAPTSSQSSVSRPGLRNLWGLAGRVSTVGQGVANLVYRMIGSTPARIAVVIGLTAAAVSVSWLLMPKTEYLPVGNQNFVFGVMLPPPGYSLEEGVRIQEEITGRLDYLWEHPAGSPEAKALPGGGLRNYFFVAFGGGAFMGVRSNDPLRVKEVISTFSEAAKRIPGTIFVMNQRSLFESGRGEGRTIDVEITGPQLERLIALGGEVFSAVTRELPDAQARPVPSLDLGNPEVRIRTHRRRAAELGLSNRELGYAVSALIDGAKASEYQFDGKAIDIKLMADQGTERRTHLLEQLPIATPDGRLTTLGSVADISVVNGPVQINHSERERTLSIQITPYERMPLEEAMDIVNEKILAPMTADGRLGGLYQARLSGTADKLAQAADSIRWNMILALVITYLLMAALFESFLYPFVILFSVPLAAAGGFLGLFAVNQFFGYQSLDVLTMLGFIILIGTVVNNAILIVHQSLNHMRDEAMAPREAIRESVRNRMRPIFMSVSTSVCGMLPLVLFPGAGSELYRGLGSVVVGGLIVSTVFTLVLVPALFSLSLDARAVVTRWFSGLVRSNRPAEGPSS